MLMDTRCPKCHARTIYGFAFLQQLCMKCTYFIGLCKINCKSTITPKSLWVIKHESITLILFKIKYIYSSVVAYIWKCKGDFWVTSVENKYQK